VDSFLGVKPLSSLLRGRRMKREDNPDGLIPGEAAAAIELTPHDGTPGPGRTPNVSITGLGFGNEPNHVSSGRPNLAQGLAEAVRAALGEAGADLGRMDFRLCDVNGEQYYFRETVNTLSRILREHKEGFPIWHPADCIGDTGAAAGAVLLAVGATAFRKGYADGPNAICQTSADAGPRAAAVLRGGAA
jgi:3-oxoacyl-[acyl-carrier-protein] synthase-1